MSIRNIWLGHLLTVVHLRSRRIVLVRGEYKFWLRPVNEVVAGAPRDAAAHVQSAVEDVLLGGGVVQHTLTRVAAMRNHGIVLVVLIGSPFGATLCSQ